jgi:tetratricopeptide (TPR) repeat protein
MVTDAQEAEEALAVTIVAEAEPTEDPVRRAQSLRSAGEFAAAEAVLSPLLNDAAGEPALLEYALIANDQRDWPVAAERWRGVLARYPDQLLARSALVNALTALRRFNEAEIEIAGLLERHPDAVQARWAAAWCAHEREAWDLAVSRWQNVLDADPEDIPAVCCHITALTNEGRDQEADAAADSALQRFGDNAQVAEACAWIPHKRGNWPLAVVRWRRLTVLDPNHAAGFACLATALRALGRQDPAKRALLRAIELAPDEIAYQTDYARTPEERAPQSVVMQASFDSPPTDPLQSARALRESREFAAADAVLKAQIDTGEPLEAALVEYALVANDQGNWPTAVQRWRLVVDRFPDQLIARAALVNALTATRQFDAAEAEVAELLERHPDERRARWIAAWCAHERSAWALAVSRWDAVLDIDPEDVAAVCCRLTALNLDGRDQEVEAAAKAALDRFPENAQVADACAWIPHNRGNWLLAVERWNRVIALDPGSASAFACLSTALRGLERYDLAERAIQRAIDISPRQFSFHLDYARIAAERGDASESRRRFSSMRERFGHDLAMLDEIGHYELRAALSQSESTSPLSDGPQQDDARSLLLSLEGLGDNCELGLLQRRFGAEPLGLFRFAAISVRNLIDGLTAGFDGVGDLDRMRIGVWHDGEFVIHDAYGIQQRTFVYERELSKERFAAQASRRQVFLRNKLLEDLREGNKLFVYRIDAISRAEAIELHLAMRTYGRPHLLCVQKAQAEHVPGTVELVQEGLMMAYMSRFAPRLELEAIEPTEWLAVCRTADALRREWLPAALKA